VILSFLFRNRSSECQDKSKEKVKTKSPHDAKQEMKNRDSVVNALLFVFSPPCFASGHAIVKMRLYPSGDSVRPLAPRFGGGNSSKAERGERRTTTVR
jgi:hypothetical protein